MYNQILHNIFSYVQYNQILTVMYSSSVVWGMLGERAKTIITENTQCVYTKISVWYVK